MDQTTTISEKERRSVHGFDHSQHIHKLKSFALVVIVNEVVKMVETLHSKLNLNDCVGSGIDTVISINLNSKIESVPIFRSYVILNTRFKSVIGKLGTYRPNVDNKHKM